MTRETGLQAVEGVMSRYSFAWDFSTIVSCGTIWNIGSWLLPASARSRRNPVVMMQATKNRDRKRMPRQQNLWVSQGGSGKAPRA